MKQPDQEQARQSRNKRLTVGIIDKETQTEEAFGALAAAGIKESGRPAGINSAIVTRKADPLVTMYDDQGRKRMIAQGNVRVMMNEGLFLECPHCHGEHDNDTPNACPALPPVKFRRCGVCAKPIYDERGALDLGEEVDPNAIPTDMPSTPELRTLAKLHKHIIVFHEDRARQMGLLRDELMARQ